MTLIQKGLEWPRQKSLPRMACVRREVKKDMMEAALTVLQDYLKVGAVPQIPIPSHVPFTQFCFKNNINFLVPWFVVSKKEGSTIKHKLNSDCRMLNQNLSPILFKMDIGVTSFHFLKEACGLAK